MSRPRYEKDTRKRVLASRRVKAQRKRVHRLLGQEAAALFAARTVTGKAKP